MENSKDIKMSEGERNVLLMLNKNYKWIARNREGELLTELERNYNNEIM